MLGKPKEKKKRVPRGVFPMLFVSLGDDELN